MHAAAGLQRAQHEEALYGLHYEHAKNEQPLWADSAAAGAMDMRLLLQGHHT